MEAEKSSFRALQLDKRTQTLMIAISTSLAVTRLAEAIGEMAWALSASGAVHYASAPNMRVLMRSGLSILNFHLGNGDDVKGTYARKRMAWNEEPSC